MTKALIHSIGILNGMGMWSSLFAGNYGWALISAAMVLIVASDGYLKSPPR